MTLQDATRDATDRWAGVPTPQVEGPIAYVEDDLDNRNYPFFLANDLDLAGRGYVAEEFFYAGKANRYDAPLPTLSVQSPPTVANVISSGHEYKTRLVVYRPSDTANFSGRVFVEWNNVSNELDNPILWQRNHDYIARSGHAYVGVAAQRYGIAPVPNGLKNWSPERYGMLDIPDVDPECDDPLFLDDHLSYDVFAQAMKAVRAVPEVMNGMPVKHVIATGLSRSAMHLSVYVNAIHPVAPIADGLILLIQGEQMRADLDIPVMKILSESEFVSFGSAQIGRRQPDTANFRTWWVTGTSHSDQQSAFSVAAARRRDVPELPLFNNEDGESEVPTYSRIEAHHVTSAAMEAMIKWIDEGVEPPHSPLPEWMESTPPALVRDEHGNARGGIQVASLAVPIATDLGTNPDPGRTPGQFRFLFGAHVPFDTATLQSLYPTHEAYVEAFTAAATQNVADGFLLQADANEMIANADASLVGTGLIAGPLCANVSNPLDNPSTANLRLHIQNYHFRGCEQLFATLDAATRLLAEGYTAAETQDLPTKRAKFEEAAVHVRRCVGEANALHANGRVPAAALGLIVEFGDLLAARILAEAAGS